MIFEVIKILILKTIAMKNSFFSKTLVIIFLFGGLSATGQVRVKTNSNKGSKNVVKNRSIDHTIDHNGRRNVRVKTNRHRVVVNKPNRSRVVVKHPTYKRPGYVWIEGYWEWNAFYGRYTWQQARWIKVKRNHYWVPGSWEVTAGGFFWIDGYWALEF